MSIRRLERLGPDHDGSTFRSGNDALDTWLRDHALASQRMDSARTFVLVEHEPSVSGHDTPGEILGYFSLTMGSVLRRDAPQKLVRGLPGYPVGAAVLARLAVDARDHGQGLGGLLLAEALRKAVAAGDAAAARLVVVDAIDDVAVSFYAHYGFVAVPDYPMRLYRRIKDVRASMGAGPDADQQ